MQKCDTNNFCKRNRGQKTAYSVDPKSIKVDGAELSAVITNTAAKQSFNFKLRAYGPVIRLMIDEIPGDHVPRYQVPDILEPSLDQQSTPWQSPESTAKKWTGQVGDVTVHVTLSNFQVEVLVGKTPVLTFNSRSLFNMEHPRKKQVGAAALQAQHTKQKTRPLLQEGLDAATRLVCSPQSSVGTSVSMQCNVFDLVSCHYCRRETRRAGGKRLSTVTQTASLLGQRRSVSTSLSQATSTSMAFQSAQQTSHCSQQQVRVGSGWLSVGGMGACHCHLA
jgi:hypothetical protein